MQPTGFECFKFNGKQFRTGLTPDGERVFAGKDVCEAAGLADGKTSIQRLEPDEVHTMPLTDQSGRLQDMLWVTESGMYALLFRSRKAQAKAFRKWVTSVVLPSIRKTGAYIAPGALPAVAADP